jgi:hypothetical protein
VGQAFIIAVSSGNLVRASSLQAPLQAVFGVVANPCRFWPFEAQFVACVQEAAGSRRVAGLTGERLRQLSAVFSAEEKSRLVQLAEVLDS